MVKADLYTGIKDWKKPIHKARATLAKSYLKVLPNIQIVGITGSVGKTLTQNAITSVLSQKYKAVVGNENLDPTFRIPQTILKTKPWDKVLVLEFGVEHPGEMTSYLKMAKPNIAVVTTIAPTHIKHFGSVHGVFDEKSKLVSALPPTGYAILNADDKEVSKMANLTVAKTLFYGKKSKDGVKISHFTQSTSGSKFRLHYKGQLATANWKVVGEHQLTSAYAAATVGIALGLTIKQIAKGLSQIKTPTHRLNVLNSKKFTILDDTYNSSPLAVEESLKTLITLGKSKQKTAVLGEMRDQGEYSQQAHAKIGKEIAKMKINSLVTIGKVAKIISESAKKNGFKGDVRNYNSTQLATREIKKTLKKSSMILVKGSRHEHLERIVNGLLGKSTAIYCFHCNKLN